MKILENLLYQHRRGEKLTRDSESFGQLTRSATMEIAVAGEILGEFFAAEVFGSARSSPKSL